jgi:hypothetical protein
MNQAGKKALIKKKNYNEALIYFLQELTFFG